MYGYSSDRIIIDKVTDSVNFATVTTTKNQIRTRVRACGGKKERERRAGKINESHDDSDTISYGREQRETMVGWVCAELGGIRRNAVEGEYVGCWDIACLPWHYSEKVSWNKILDLEAEYTYLNMSCQSLR